MRTDFPARLQLELNSPTKCIAYFWIVTRRDGTVYGFTDHDRDVTVLDVLCRAGTGATPSSIQSRTGLAVDNLEVQTLIDGEVFLDAELINGLWDFAAVQCGVFVWTSPSNSAAVLKAGTLGEVRLDGGMFTAELRGLMQVLQQQAGRRLGPDCDVELGSPWCGVDLAPYTFTGVITSVSSDRKTFVLPQAQADGYFDYGMFELLSGPASGFRGSVFSWVGGVLVLTLALSVQPLAGDSYRITRGCDGRAATCRDVFANKINFQGFEDVPGVDQITRGAL
ncbi:DUF2163 domain-containing protein [Chitinolyticbacter meiyuanensis]|uniref:DUF2163 domain-containing protein n=1 Tax=Chitinolyticbacter meiyuanensis TaxID=682798 RepID=UPI0011E5E0D2|nr:DUF2163 domain-containing protein [Chitinolyticbacter meiyuanensis]